MVPPRLLVWKNVLENAIETMKDDFLLGVKKAIVDFVLRDPAIVESIIADFDSAERRDVKATLDEYGLKFKATHQKIGKCLYLVNPCIASLIDLWYSDYRYMCFVYFKGVFYCLCLFCRNLRLVDVTYFFERTFTLGDFEYIAKSQIYNSQNTLLTKYLAGVQHIFLQGNKEGKLPNPNCPIKFTKFYNCVSTIMEYQLQTLCLQSLAEYSHFLHDIGVSDFIFIWLWYISTFTDNLETKNFRGLSSTLSNGE